MAELFAPIEPYDQGVLETNDGHQVYWERCGDPNGVDALYLHGGPGSGCTVNQRRLFDPEIFNVVLLDQRGSGRSRPLASDFNADLTTNTTAHLLRDLEALRTQFAVEKWVVTGMSWGTTLALAYAETYPERVSAMLLALVGTTSRAEVEWMTQSVARIFPKEWDRFTSAVPASLRELRPVDAYARLLSDPNPDVRDRAAVQWCAWEDAHVSLPADSEPNPRFLDPEFRLRFARLVTHYWSNSAFLDEDQLIRDATVLEGIPGVMIHGRFDVSGPLITAYRLSQQWPTSRLEVIDDAGHGGGERFLNAVLLGLNELSQSARA